jgi:PAS domain S-box-containing protein
MSNLRQDLPASGEEFALLVDAVEDYAIFLLSPRGEIQSWNRGAARMIGYTADEVVGKLFSIFYTEEDLRNEKPRHELETAVAEGRVEDEGWRIRKDGTRFWANTVITALHDHGRLIGFAKVTRDLTERRAAEERLRQSEELFRLLVSSVRDYAIFMLDPNGNVATWNAGARRIKQYEANEIIGRHFSTFYPEEDVKAGKPEWELKVATEKGSVEDEGWRVRKDGTRFFANVVITAVKDADGRLRGFAKVTRDITDRRQAEEMRQSLLEQREARLQAEEQKRHAETSYLAAMEANRAKDDFLMTLSHELRTPMTSVLGWARLLPTMNPDDPMFAEAVNAIDRSAQLQARLIDDVLDLSRIMSGKLRLTRETVDIERLLRDSVDGVRPTAAAREVKITTAFDSGLGSMIADPTRLQQVLWNLLTNAVKFTPKKGAVHVAAVRSGSHVMMTVKDTGEGIAPEFLPHIFEAFRQGESPRTRVHGGLGLGLSIVRYIVEAHGGAVAAESEGRDKGATFRVTLPIGAERSDVIVEPKSAMRQAIAVDAKRLAGLKILIVDDDRETRDFVRTVLRQAGATVATVDSAYAALNHFEEDRPEIMLTDIAMPGMDGYELSRTIRRRAGGDKVKIIAFTAFPSGTAAAEQSGFDKYLTKPMDPSDLINELAAIAGR